MTKKEKMRVVPKRDDAGVAPGMLAHLSDLHDFMIADPDPDIRGWKVVLPDNRRVGKVDDLIVDTTDMVVKYLEVKVDAEVLASDEDTWVLVPIGAARVDERDDVVVVDRLPAAGLAGAPRFERGAPTPEQEEALRDYYEPATRAAGKRQGGLFDQQRFWGKRRKGREQAPYLTRTRGVPEGAGPRAGEVVIEEVIVDGIVVEKDVALVDEPGERRARHADRDAERGRGGEAR
jgi:sporulation protein YlmC with PRC-barrel domain